MYIWTHKYTYPLPEQAVDKRKSMYAQSAHKQREVPLNIYSIYAWRIGFLVNVCDSENGEYEILKRGRKKNEN